MVSGISYGPIARVKSSAKGVGLASPAAEIGKTDNAVVLCISADLPFAHARFCGAEGLDHVLANLGDLTLGSAMDGSAVLDGSADPVAAIQAAPHTFMARAPIRPAAIPVWRPSGAATRYTVMRLFACATDQGFAVMPGGLAITAPDVASLIADCPERLQSKDIWVLSDQPVAPFSLMGGLQTATAVSRGSDLPSRVADHLLWLGRYLERAEGLVRLLRSVFRRLSGEARPAEIPELSFLLNLLRADNTIPPSADMDDGIPLYRDLLAQLEAALYQQDRPESVVAILKRVKEAARNVRDRLSLDSWRAINRLEAFADAPAGDCSVLVGFYDRQTGRRVDLAAGGDGAHGEPPGGDRSAGKLSVDLRGAG